MALRHVLGVDHVVVAVRDLDAAAASWRALGFTVSSRGTHSARLGSANHTIMLGPDYIELIGVLVPTPHNAPMRDFLAMREGLERIALATDDAAAGAAEVRALGIAAGDPIHFGRPVMLPGGETAEARFNVFQWPQAERPGGVRLFACEHLTPGHVWIPALRSHANAATRLCRVEFVSPDPAAAASHMARLIGGTAVPESAGGFLVASGPGRADLVFLDRAALARRHPEAEFLHLPEEGAAVLVIGTSDPAAAARACGVAPGAAPLVQAVAATGVALRFVQD